MIYLLLSVILFSFNNVLWKKNLEQLSVPFLIVYRAIFTILISTGVFFYFGIEWHLFVGFSFFRVTVGSVFGVIGLYCMLSVIKKASLQWLGIYNLVSIFFIGVYLYFFETIHMTHSLLGLILIMGGFGLYVFGQKRSKQQLNFKQHGLLTLMVLGFGISSVLHWKNLDASIPAIFILFNQELVVLVTSFSILYFSKSLIPLPVVFLKSYFFKVVLMAIVVFMALYLSFVGLKFTNPVISAVLFLATPLLTIIFGAIFFREKISITNAISIVLIATGAFWVHYYTV